MTLTVPRTRRAGPLVAVAVVLLALGFATGLLVNRYGPFARPAGTSKAQPQLASDGYTPTGLDYREDHRLTRAEEQPARADYRAQHETLSPPVPSAAPSYRESHGLDPRPAAPGAPRSTGTCRAGSVDCLPDDDYTGGDTSPAPVAAPAGNAAPTTGPCPGRDLALTGACGPEAPAAVPAPSGDDYVPSRMDYREDHRTDRQPAATPTPDQDPDAPHLVP